jgi:hypothetical protein
MTKNAFIFSGWLSINFYLLILILQESNNNKKVWITKTNILKLNLNQLDCFSVIVYYYGPNVGPIYCQFVKFLLECDKFDNR